MTTQKIIGLICKTVAYIATLVMWATIYFLSTISGADPYMLLQIIVTAICALIYLTKTAKYKSICKTVEALEKRLEELEAQQAVTAAIEKSEKRED